MDNNQSSYNVHPGTSGFYNKRPGTACLGQFYETKLLTLVLLRLLKDDKVDQFHLGTNMDEAGAFDDLVLRYSREGKEFAVFLQAKHVQQSHINFIDMIKEPKGSFSLMKYFDSFIKIRKLLKADNLNIMFKGDFGRIETVFSIYTTTSIKCDKEEILKNDDRVKLLPTHSNGTSLNLEIFSKHYMTDFISNLRKELAKDKPSLKLKNEDVNDKMVRDFLEKLVFYTDQWTEDKFDEIIIEEIAHQRGKLKFLKLHDTVQTWWKQSGKVPFLTKNCNFFKNSIKDVDNSQLESMHSVSESKVRSYNTFFSKESFEKLHSDLDLVADRKIQIILSSQPELTALKLIQYFEDKNYKYINTKLIGDEYVKDFFTNSSINQPFLILSQNGSTIEQNEEICRNIDRLVVITNQIPDEIYVEDKNIGLSDLNSESQRMIMNCKVSFQGKATVLGSFIGNNLELVNGDILARLLSGETIEIAKPSEKEVLPYFIPRTFRQCELKGEIINNESFHFISDESQKTLTADDNDVIISYEIPDESLFKRSPNPVNTSADSGNNETFNNPKKARTYFEQLCEQYPNRNIHLLSKSKSMPMATTSEFDLQIIWHQSRGSLEKLRGFIKEDTINEFQLRTIDDMQSEVMIIAAGPGMGKTTILESFSREFFEGGCSGWVLIINLLHYSMQFEKWIQSQELLDKNNVSDFLIQLLSGGNNSNDLDLFSRDVFLKCCKEKQLILLVDGFDEICPDYQKLVEQLLTVSKENFTSKLLVTTRSGNAQLALENCLSTMAHTLKPFTSKDQDDFIRKFYELKVKTDFNKNRYSLYRNKLFPMFSRSIDNRSEEFLGVPLQIKMLALIFENTFKSSMQSEDNTWKFNLEHNNDFNLIHLYDKFMDIQIRNVLEGNKKGTDLSNPINKRTFEKNRKDLLKNHMKAAVHILFNEKEKRILFTAGDNLKVEEFLGEVRAGDDKTGIIYQNTSGGISFIHQTYSEYFAALWIAEMYSTLSEQNFENFIKQILIESLLVGNKAQICRFLQMKIRENIKMVKAKSFKSRRLLEELMGTFSFLENILQDHASKELLKIVDHLVDNNDQQISRVLVGMDRKSLLAAVSITGCTKLLNMIREHVNVNEELNGFSSLHLAAFGNHVTTADVLIDSGAVVDKRRISTDGSTPLMIAAERGFVEVCELILEKGADANAVALNDGCTALHWAAQKNSQKIAELLIAKGAIVDSRKTTAARSTPLIIASRHNSIEVAKTLLENGADINAVGLSDGFTALHWTAQKNFQNIAELLIAKGAILDSRKTTADGSTPLIIAAEFGSLEVAKALLENGADANTGRLDCGYTALHWTAQKNFRNIAELLIEKGAMIDSRKTTDDGATPLIIAAEYGSLEVAKELLENCADVNAGKLNNGFTALHWAAQENFRNIAKLLIEKGAIVDSRKTTNDGSTPLNIAARNNSTEVAKTLLENGADVNAVKLNNGFTALHWAAQKNFQNIAELLIEKGAIVDSRKSTDDGSTPLIIAATFNSIEVANTLLENGADINAGRLDCGFTALHWAAQENFQNIAELLIEKGAIVDSRKTTDDGATPLIVAAEYGSLEVAKALLENGADVNAGQLNSGFTALHWAAQENFKNIAELLIEKGAIVDSRKTTADGSTPLIIATTFNSIEVANTLLENDADVNAIELDDGYTALHWASQKNFQDIAKLLIAKGAIVDSRNSTADGSTPLIIAARNNSIEVAKILMENSADVNAAELENGFTALHWAAQKNTLNIAKLLIAKGAIVDSRKTTADGSTPLIIAAEYGSLEVAKTLLENSADANAGKLDNGYTALHWAAQKNFQNIAEVLIRKGADVNTRNTTADRSTPLMTAVMNNSAEVVKLLKENGAV